MSRGLGKREKQILQALGQSSKGYMALRDVLGQTYTRAEYSSINRACWRLQEKGLIDVYKPQQASIRVAISLPGVYVPNLAFLYQR